MRKQRYEVKTISRHGREEIFLMKRLANAEKLVRDVSALGGSGRVKDLETDEIVYRAGSKK